jgi:hypothetical protein
VGSEPAIENGQPPATRSHRHVDFRYEPNADAPTRQAAAPEIKPPLSMQSSTFESPV